MSPFLTDEVSPELSPSPSQGNTAPRFKASGMGQGDADPTDFWLKIFCPPKVHI